MLLTRVVRLAVPTYLTLLGLQALSLFLGLLANGLSSSRSRAILPLNGRAQSSSTSISLIVDAALAARDDIATVGGVVAESQLQPSVLGEPHQLRPPLPAVSQLLHLPALAVSQLLWHLPLLAVPQLMLLLLPLHLPLHLPHHLLCGRADYLVVLWCCVPIIRT